MASAGLLLLVSSFFLLENIFFMVLGTLGALLIAQQTIPQVTSDTEVSLRLYLQ
jgi:hypothetical protein